MAKTMKTSKAGIDLIKSFESCKLTAYKCPSGIWTIGWGHTGTVGMRAIRKGMTITQTKADELLRSDLRKFEKMVNSKSYVTGFKPNQAQFDALVSFAYNCGGGNLKCLCANGRDAETVCKKMVLYNKSCGKTLNGLVRRRKAEQALFNRK